MFFLSFFIIIISKKHNEIKNSIRFDIGLSFRSNPLSFDEITMLYVHFIGRVIGFKKISSISHNKSSLVAGNVQEQHKGIFINIFYNANPVKRTVV